MSDGDDTVPPTTGGTEPTTKKSNRPVLLLSIACGVLAVITCVTLVLTLMTRSALNDETTKRKAVASSVEELDQRLTTLEGKVRELDDTDLDHTLGIQDADDKAGAAFKEGTEAKECTLAILDAMSRQTTAVRDLSKCRTNIPPP